MDVGEGIEEWDRARERVVALVSGLDDDESERHVPACPDWTVRDLLSHMVGLGTDVAAGDEPDDHNDEWTGRQVDERRGRTVAELLGEWELVAEPLRGWMRENGTRPLGDVIIHEQDMRGAVGVPGAQDTAAVAELRARFADRFAQRLDGLGDLPPIALRAPDWSWCSAGPVENAAVLVEASGFDLHRLLVTRRSERQLRSWTTRGDVGPYLDAFALLGPLPSVDLTE